MQQEKLFNSLPQEDLDAMNLDGCYLLLFTNIHGLEYFSAPLASPERIARNVNPLVLFRDYNALASFYTNLSLKEIMSNDKDISDFTIREKLTYYLVEQHEHVFKNNESLTYIMNLNLTEKNSDLLEKEFQRKYEICNKLVKDIPIYNEITPNVISLLHDIVPNKYYVETQIGDLKYNIDCLKLYLYIRENMNTLFSLYALATNSDYKADIKCVKLTNEDLLKLWAISIPYLNNDIHMLSYMTAKDKEYFAFPTYEIWKKLEIEFYDGIKDRLIDFDDIVKQIIDNPIDNIKDDNCNMIDFSSF